MRVHQRDRNGHHHRIPCSLYRSEEGQDGYPTLGLLCEFCGVVRAFSSACVVISLLTTNTDALPHSAIGNSFQMGLTFASWWDISVLAFGNWVGKLSLSSSTCVSKLSIPYATRASISPSPPLPHLLPDRRKLLTSNGLTNFIMHWCVLESRYCCSI